MSRSRQHTGSTYPRGIAICLLSILSLSVWQTSLSASCGDYLMSHQEHSQTAVMLHSFEAHWFPGIPDRCPHGDCHPQDQTPAPVGSTSDTRVVDDLRLLGWSTAPNSLSRSSGAARLHPADDLLPESPFNAEVERPPQTRAV